MEEILTAKEFKAKVENSQGGVVVLLTGQGCPSCPAVKRRVRDMEPKLKPAVVYEVSRDRVPEVAMKYELMAVPVIMVFENGTPKVWWMGSTAGVEFGKFALNWAPGSKPPQR